VGGEGGTMYTYISKCKNNKRKRKPRVKKKKVYNEYIQSSGWVCTNSSHDSKYASVVVTPYLV
jgi:hypothetical protein